MAVEVMTFIDQPRPVSKPIAANERVEVIDVLRGFAILGILLVNMAAYNSADSIALSSLWSSSIDRSAARAIEFLAQGKFYSLFSFLFGLGLMVQMARAEKNGVRFVPLYLRRIFVLLIIGTAHALLLWSGDILHMYAILGLLLLLFRRRSPKTLLVWSGISLLIPILLIAALTWFDQSQRSTRAGAERMTREDAVEQIQEHNAAEHASRTYSTGSYSEMIRQRLKDLTDGLPAMVIYMPHSFVMLLLGLYAGRRLILHDIKMHIDFIRKLCWWSLAIGLVGNTVFVLTVDNSVFSNPTLASGIGAIGYLIGAPALCFFYISVIVLLHQQPKWKTRFAVFAPAGRMALTNYLLQSIICTTIFYSYGFGLYDKIGPASSIVLTIIVYLIQIPLSIWWLKHFQFGPMEWLWRSLTYMYAQPMRKTLSNPIGDEK